MIGKGGLLAKPKIKTAAERVARTASDTFSRRELARRSNDLDATVRFVNQDQISSSVVAEVKQHEPQQNDAVAAHAAACLGDETIDGFVDETQVHVKEEAQEKHINLKLDHAIRENVLLLDRFRLVRQIGAGSYGRVILAVDETAGREVAVKIHFNTLGLSDAADEGRKRVERSFELQQKILSPYCVQTVALLVTEFGHVLVEEFANGNNLKQLVQEHGPLPEGQVIRVGIQMCSVLQTAHSVLKIVHRDIKPDNIVMLPNGDCKLIDWGCARSNSKDKRDTGGVSLEDIEALDIDAVVDTLTIAGLIIGTPNYMAPEQVDGQRVTIQSDICSLGATLVFLATGQKPFAEPTLGKLLKSILFDPAPNPNDLLPKGLRKLSKPFCRVLAKAMEKKPKNRYTTPKEMKQALEACLKSKDESKKSTGLLDSFRNWFKS